MPVLLGNRVSSRVSSRASAVTSRLSSRLLLSLLLCVGVFGAGLLYAQNTLDSRTVGKTSVEASNGSVLKYALVIGNTKYAGKAALKNPRNDAEDMEKLLRKLGFEVIVGYDLNRQQMGDKLSAFGKAIANRDSDDIALFYYSGHGAQYEEKNYLIPLGAEDTPPNLLDNDTLGVDRVLQVMHRKQHGGNIVILDACRNNPFSFGGKGSKGDQENKGLNAVGGGDNTLIAYATDTGKTASDNPDERNGLYTGELLKNLGTPNLSLGDVFASTRRGVVEKSNGGQTPRELDSLFSNPVLFVDGSGSVVATVVCPEGTNLVGGECIAPVVCLSGSVWDGKNCVGQLASIPVPVVKPSVSSDAWVTLSGGSFTMGCVDGDGACHDDEKGSNRRRERVSSFQLMRTEVTVDMYKKCVDAGVCSAPKDKSFDSRCNWGYSDRGDHPVNCVDWNQAVQYCDYVGGRLPSAVEWEYAAKSGGKNQKYPWGDEEASCTYAVMSDGVGGCSEGRTWPVCSKPSGNSAQGICDLSGNVYEWTSVQHDGNNKKELRGGSWNAYPRDLRASNRNGNTPDLRNGFIGFRCAQ